MTYERMIEVLERLLDRAMREEIAMHNLVLKESETARHEEACAIQAAIELLKQRITRNTHTDAVRIVPKAEFDALVESGSAVEVTA